MHHQGESDDEYDLNQLPDNESSDEEQDDSDEYGAEDGEDLNNYKGIYFKEEAKKYTWEEICDQMCRYYTNGTCDLEWFKKQGAITRPVNVEEQYDIHVARMTEKCGMTGT